MQRRLRTLTPPIRKTSMPVPMRLPLALAPALAYPVHAAEQPADAPDVLQAASTVTINADRLQND